MSTSVFSIVVALDPPPGFASRVQSIAAQCDATVIVDNGSIEAIQLHSIARGASNLHLIRHDENLGLAKGLNVGIQKAWELGASHVVLLDHDSTVTPGMVAALLKEIDTSTSVEEAIAVPIVTFTDHDNLCRWPQTVRSGGFRFRFIYGRDLEKPTAVDLAIGSGMCFSVDIWHRIGGFDDQLFVDLVDTDFCLRARSNHIPVVAVPTAKLGHDIGTPDRKNLPILGPVFPTHHSCFRHYYIARNRMSLIQRHGLRFPSWMIYETLSGIKLTAKVIVFEKERLKKLKAMLRGTRDGLRIVTERRHGARTTPRATKLGP